MVRILFQGFRPVERSLNVAYPPKGDDIMRLKLGSVRQAFDELANCHIDPRFGKRILKADNEFYKEGDEEAPFFSETYLYAIIEKDDARVILARIKKLEDAVRRQEKELSRLLNIYRLARSLVRAIAALRRAERTALRSRYIVMLRQRCTLAERNLRTLIIKKEEEV